MKRPVATPARRRAVWIHTLGLGLLLWGQTVWAVEPIGQPDDVLPLLSANFGELMDFPPVVGSSGFNYLSADSEAWMGSDPVPTAGAAKETVWSPAAPPAALPQPNHFLALVLLGWVTIGIGILCRLSLEECKQMADHRG